MLTCKTGLPTLPDAVADKCNTLSQPVVDQASNTVAHYRNLSELSAMNGFAIFLEDALKTIEEIIVNLLESTTTLGDLFPQNDAPRTRTIREDSIFDNYRYATSGAMDRCFDACHKREQQIQQEWNSKWGRPSSPLKDISSHQEYGQASPELGKAQPLAPTAATSNSFSHDPGHKHNQSGTATLLKSETRYPRNKSGSMAKLHASDNGQHCELTLNKNDFKYVQCPGHRIVTLTLTMHSSENICSSASRFTIATLKGVPIVFLSSRRKRRWKAITLNVIASFTSGSAQNATVFFPANINSGLTLVHHMVKAAYTARLWIKCLSMLE